jgi:stage V sporulation protein R
MKNKDISLELARAQERIESIAAEYGLTYFQTGFEVVDYEQMNALAAYGGFPTRYPHYRFGMEYNQLSKSYEYGLHKIYEMVINNDPTYAYLLEGNTMLDQKLVMAHVYGHADFFKNNMYFTHTNRKMIDDMANHATRIRRYQEQYGIERIERFLDDCLAIQELIDPALGFFEAKPESATEKADPREESSGRMPSKEDYLDRYVNPPEYIAEQMRKMQQEQEEAKHSLPHPVRDVLDLIMRHAPLQNWERDLLGIVREESYYFLPQRQTKVMNEGWATYWHSKIMTSRVLTDAEIIDYADHHAGTVATAPGSLNPYKLGLELFRDIERRWDRGQFGPEWAACENMAERHSWDRKLGLGRQKIFEVRRIHCDITFLDEFLTPEFCQEQQLFVSQEDGRTKQAVVSSREFNEVKQALLFQFTNGGRPVVEATDINYANRGELLLLHRHVGVDLRLDWAQDVLEGLARLWRRPIRLETVRAGKPVRLGHDGDAPMEESIEHVAEEVAPTAA